MRFIICFICYFLVLGCSNTKIQTEKKANPQEFKRLINTGSSREIATAMFKFFKERASVSTYSEILPLADDKEVKEDEVKYVFWFRGKDPRIEGDGRVWVFVDKESQTIKKVSPNWLLK